MVLLEIACFNPASAIIASGAGADRVELCDNADVGGTTPPLEWLSEIQDKVSVPINVMIRPRGGDFVYSHDELSEMKDAIVTFKSSNLVSGLVFGILKPDHTVDVDKTRELVKLAAPLPCTFHRAFDECRDPMNALEDIMGCGIKTILTSGCAPNVAQGTKILSELVKAAGERVVIMPGGGVRSTNVNLLRKETAAIAYHSSALVEHATLASAEEIARIKTQLQLPT